MTLTTGSIEGKQLNLCRGYIIFCHVDCLCLQEKKEDEARSIFLFLRLRPLPQQSSQQMITLKMADHRWSDIYVVLPRSFTVVTFVFGKSQS